MGSPYDILKQYWGYTEFRPRQLDIIDSVLNGKDTLALLPTGGGKSICFQVPGLLLDGVCIVVSPLVALMNDQVYQLKKRGVKATSLHAGLSRKEIDILLDNCVHGQVKFLYVSPERLSTEIFIERVKQMEVGLLAIDEAHCISQWGYDFRPAYVEIAQIYEVLSEVKKIALTATATRDVKRDICEKLEFVQPQIFQKSFARRNLSYSVFELENKGPKMLDILQNVQGSAIVYVRSRKETENVAKFLYQNGISSDFYHAGLDTERRDKKQKDWIENVRRVMVCTNAFGMGIDKPDVRLVIHLDLPDSLEAYYQEAGRAGRDEKNAFAVLLYGATDIYNLERNQRLQNPSFDFVQRVYQSLANYYKLATGSSEWQSFDFDLKEFSYQYQLNPMEVFHTIRKIQEMGVLLLTETPSKTSSLKIELNHSELYKFNISNANLEPLINGLLRLYGGGLYSEFMTISEFELAKVCQDSKSVVVRKLKILNDQGIVTYRPMKTRPQLTYILPRLETSALKKYFKMTEPRKKVTEQKVRAMIRYTRNTSGCRTRVFQEYFDEVTYLNCGVCDVCIASKKEAGFDVELDKLRRKILHEISSQNHLINDLKQKLNQKNEFLLTEAIRTLMDDEVVFLNDEDEIEMTPPTPSSL